LTWIEKELEGLNVTHITLVNLVAPFESVVICIIVTNDRGDLCALEPLTWPVKDGGNIDILVATDNGIRDAAVLKV
jgi:hypothetical protein